MQKRKIIFGSYDTAVYGWTLASWSLTAAQEKTNFVNIPGGDGSLDLSTALTGGISVYNDRTLTAILECSEGNRLSRDALISEMINKLDGMRVDIELPDDPLRRINGRLHIAKNYSDLAHCSVTVTATCKPWKESNTETKITLTSSTSQKTATLVNNGRRASVPTLTVSGSSANVLIGYGSASKAFSAGTYKWPDLLLTPGEHEITYSGTGALTITYREAVLE
jgi:hypothetical protein